MQSALTQRLRIPNFYLLAAIGAILTVAGTLAAFYMEHHGHQVTGMNNQVFWGLPHVFAIFLIVGASGVLNVASIGTVFGKKVYKPRGPLSGLLAITMLAAGLFVIMLDLGRADRLIVAMTHVNWTSVFGWNMVLYPVFFGLVGLYVWLLLDRKMYAYSKAAGTAAFIWRLVMTTGTGSIFGFVVARQAYHSAVIAPMFIIMSFAWGLAMFLLFQTAMYKWQGTQLNEEIRLRLNNLLGTFVAAVAYFVVVYHLTNIYYAKQTAFEHFILVSGGIYPQLFWVGFVVVGTLLPLLFVFVPALRNTPSSSILASIFTILGGLAFLYVFIIGGQAYPLEIFPGMEVKSSFFDGVVDPYTPSLPEILLSIGGFGLYFLLSLLAVHVLPFMPQDDIAQLQASGALHD
ncbi:NrfD/PsrC family molybdoenzyme membrane anchor subunit [Sulfuricystis multivorans]|uniref:NrfD/PsrC family molybdoenzyme membrane anchor subunit n=1 Tax=Sulfuricystis multivorans TaxID=2211108 RepID=UPI000F827000|nr:NrfD/PsrC family molybdoenzyme membrane anchor subunit [Sulfuricystis multivorans]